MVLNICLGMLWTLIVLILEDLLVSLVTSDWTLFDGPEALLDLNGLLLRGKVQLLQLQTFTLYHGDEVTIRVLTLKLIQIEL